MAENRLGSGNAVLSSRTVYHIVVLVLVQFLFKFSQGQGPGTDEKQFFNISENRPPGTYVGTIHTKPLYTYNFNQNPDNNPIEKDYFSLNSSTGVITTKVEIDRELLELPGDVFDILIIAAGHTTSQPTYPVEISITVLDKNDNAPHFPNPIERIYFRENLPPNNSLVHINTAIDADVGINAKIQDYQITFGDGPFQLVYEPIKNGEILIIKPTEKLDREKQAAYQLEIIAKDNGSPQLTGTVHVYITVLDDNDNSPLFDPTTYHASVNETDDIDTLVIHVVASDSDTGINQVVSYSFVETSSYTNQFRIDENTGEIFTAKQPLQCPELSCLLTVTATDNGTPQYIGRALVFVTIVDTNNHDPVITIRYVPNSNTEFSSVNEDAKDGDTVAGIVASDKDLGEYGQVTVRIVAGNELEHFRLQELMPLYSFLRVNGDSVLDRERHSMYNLTIEARDDGSPPRSTIKSLVIYINDINEHPPVFIKKRFNMSISETSEIGSFVADMRATDADSGENAKLTYNILSGNDRETFHINSNTGLVTTAKTLHYEVDKYFKMNVSVHDGALYPFYDSTELEIQIWDENDNTPLFAQQELTVSLDENLRSNAPVVSVSASDNDSGLNGTILYQFHPSVSRYPNTFHLDSETGSVTTTRSLDRETIPEYTIKIVAKDHGINPLSSTATVTLNVRDVNDNAPIFYPKKYFAEVMEGQGPNVEVTLVSATDADEGDNAVIEYLFSGSDFGKFVINSETGHIKTTETLTKQVQSKYTLTILAREKFGQRSDTSTVDISVVSPTDNKPTFSKNVYTFHIVEDPANTPPTRINSNIGSISAQSGSSAAQIVYTLVNGDPAHVFSLDSSTGWIKRVKLIDRETYPSFSLDIVAVAGDLFAQTVVNIIVDDENDNQPTFVYPSLEVDIFEDWPVGHHIELINASDADSGINSRITYSITRNQKNVFGINTDSGLLYLNKPVSSLEASTGRLTVQAMDSGSPQYSSTQEIYVTVKDVNNHSPRFKHTTYEFSLLESNAVNGRFFHLKATDADTGENGRITYNITRGDEDHKFGIFPDGFLYIAKALDRETKDLYKLSVIARDNNKIQPRSSECNITIHVSDYNDNNPMFINATYSFNVFENKPTGTTIGSVLAMDTDIGRNAELTYYLSPNERNFKLDSQTGEITTSKSFDREALLEIDSTFTFDVTVKDNGLTRLTDTVTVRVQILDENDSPPVFRKPVYKLNVFENEAILANLTVIKADDKDAGINGIVTYMITDGNNEDKFRIGQTTGQIVLNQGLDRETEDSYKLTIVATDSGVDVQHSATAVVQIAVLDINDNFPLFAQTSMEVIVKEDVLPGNMVVHFSATDIDLGVNGDIRYSMSGTDNDGTFGIDEHTGKIYLRKPLDFEKKQGYNLNITATDQGNPPLPYYVRFKIKVEDVNDNYPVWPINRAHTFRILEDFSGSVGLLEQATDADSDENGEIQYNIIFQDPPGDHFKIVANTGQLYIDKEVDREIADLYSLTVQASDQARNVSNRLTSETVVSIFIDDINDHDPEFISFNAIKVLKNTPKNEFLATIVATDKDIGINSKISLQIVQGNGNYFGLESISGRFYLANNLPSTPLKYDLKIQASDYGTPDQRITKFDVTVIVTDNSEGPDFEQVTYSGSVKESDGVGTSILRVLATSSRINSAVEYYITNITVASSETQVGRYFKVDKSSGELSTAMLLDRESVGSEFDVEIYAMETTGDRPRTSVKMARILLEDENDTPPRFSQNIYIESADEDVDIGTTITKVTVYDEDSVGGLQLTIVDGNDGRLKIQQDGSIVTTGDLDYETTKRYTLTLSANDGVQSSTCVVILNIKDKNDNPPDFERTFYSFDVDEDTPIGTTIGSVRAHDQDEGVSGVVTYYLTSEWGRSMFELDPVLGTFKLLRVLDFEENQLYTLVVRATDGGTPTQNSTVTVFFNVKDTNDNTPLFEHAAYDRAIYENVREDSSIIQVVATDIDSASAVSPIHLKLGINGDVSYSIIDGDPDGQFRIDPSTGIVYSTQKLDRETTPAYTLVVMATDMAEPPSNRLTAVTDVLITLKDINDFVPEFVSPNVIEVMENTPVNTVVHSVIIRDLDEGTNSPVEFSIVSSGGGSPFSLGKNDGKLRVNTTLDRETVENYTMTITVKDQGSPKLSATQKLVVIIGDDNDHDPVFSPELYDTVVHEDVQIGTTLLSVSATDMDTGLNGIVLYFIIGGDNNHDFSLDQSSGMLRVQKGLDYERIQNYSLIVQAEDSGSDLRSATVTVAIDVLDINDNEPIFLDLPYIGYVREEMDVAPVHVKKVLAVDYDDRPYNQLQYAIRGSNYGMFNISVDTGEIMLWRKVDREVESSYMLTVIATDSATGRGLTGTCTVTIFVEDINDNTPMFEHNNTYNAHIMENLPGDSDVIVVKATDADEGANAQIIYSLKDNMDNKFAIFPDTGRIATMTELDREDVSMYTLEVVARDASILPRSSTTTVRVYVDDDNDNAPVFDRTEYTQTVQPPVVQGTFVLGVASNDSDIMDNGLVTYSLSHTDFVFFDVDPVTGVITAKLSLTNGRTYSFDVTSTDKGSSPKHKTVPVTVQIASSIPSSLPVFNTIPTGLNVVENLDLDRIVTTVTARSSIGATINYHIAGGNIGNAFGIVPDSGKIFVNGVIDYEVVEEYHLWIEAKQDGNAPGSQFAEVVIGVDDVNDNVPRFSQTLYNVSLSEWPSAFGAFGASVETVAATDTDSGDNGKVRFLLTGKDSPKFKVDELTGKILLFTQLDREDVDLYSFSVLAVDQGPFIERKTSSASVIVNVLDQNDNAPKFTQQFGVKIPENTEVGSFVLRVTTTDADIGNNAKATYSLADDKFAIGSLSGNITLLKPLDAETQSSYELRVMVSDGSHDIESTVEIEVTDVNDNEPQILPPHVFSFPEQQPIGSFVGQLVGTDDDIDDPNNQIYFSLKLPSNYFDLNSDNGEITSQEELEYHHSNDPLVNRHELVVLAKDLGTPARSSEVTVYINIVDDNDYAPQFEFQSYFSAVPESARTDQSILKVIARDDHDYGENAQVEYFVTGGNGTSLFKVNRYTGTVSVATSLIGTRNREFYIVVKAEDKGTPPQSSSVSVHLVVTDVNQHTPQFIIPVTMQITVPENKSVGDLIETFSATDDDTGLNAEVVYSISNGNDHGLFEMDSKKGTLSVNKALDYEAAHDYTLSVTARDRALFSKEMTVDYVIRLSDVNDNDPEFRQSEDATNVDENSPYDTTVYHALATDADTGRNAVIQYAIVADVQAQAKFKINENTGVVTTKADLDYESRDTYTLTIMAMNPGSSRKSAIMLTVNLNGENEFIPQFVQKSYYFSISESAPMKTEVGLVSATDDDTGLDGIIYYFLVADSNSKGFKLNPRTGEIYVSGRPDYESSPRITLTVLAKNWGSIKGDDTDTCTVHISVEDANDPPVFTQQVYTAYIPEGSGAGVSVYTVTAKDYDVEITDRQFTYTILSGPSTDRFHIDSATGYIKTTGVGTFDREVVPTYNISVGAVDTGSPPETGSATVQIHLNDINDNGPLFVDFTATVAENQTIGTLVTTLTQYTVDPDGPSNQGPYIYRKLPGSVPEYAYFDINQNNGAVKTRRVIDRELTPKFIVPIIVEDSGSPKMSSTLSFKVMVTDLNDTPPRPRFLTVFVSLYDNQYPAGKIADVRPLDLDLVGQYECNLNSNNIPFRITPSTCDLMLNEYPKSISYTLEVTGHDSIFSDVVYDVSVKISKFDNLTLAHTVIVQLAKVTANDFMDSSYTSFMSSVQALFQNRDEVFLYGIMQQANGNLLLYLAVQQETLEYYYVDIVKQRLKDAKNTIQSDSGVTIMDVSYSECLASTCKNNGECISHVIVSSTNEVADSLHQSLSSPSLSLDTKCTCLPQYTGPDCSEPASPCGDTYCQNGGTCLNQGTSYTCHCTDTWTGTSCERDVDECQNDVCQNNARCENLQGSFTCHCKDGYSGKYCQDGFDYCADTPCTRGKCRNVLDGYECDCPYKFWGSKCEYTSRGFKELSYMEFSKLTELNNEIELIFATNKQNALLLYNPSSELTSTEFIALEILNGRIRFSVSLGTQNPSTINIDTNVATGDWFKVKANRNRDTSKVWVEECPSDGGPCSQCQLGSPCYGQGDTQSTERLELGTQPLSIGGIRDINTILDRGNQVASHDFVGCMRYFRVNGRDLLSSPVDSAGVSDECPRSSTDDVCYNWQCKNGGACIREWAGPICRCPIKFAGQHCEQELRPFGFSPDSMVRITPHETYRRDQLLSENRRRRAVSESSVLVRFRTTANDGLLLFTSTLGGNKYSALSVIDGRLQFTVSQYGAIKHATLTSPWVSDGDWHNATVVIAASGITLQLDGDHQVTPAFTAFPFTSLDVKELSLGGSTNMITIEQKSMKDFDGCISMFKLDGVQLPMNASTERYSIEVVGGVENGCSGLCDNACDGRKCSVEGEAIVCAIDSDDDGPLSIGVIVVIIFFAVLIVVIIIIFVVFRYRRQYCMKGKDASKQNGPTLSMTVTSNNAHSPQDSGYGENNIDELIIRNHIAQELAGNKYHHQNGRLMRPDIIESDRSRPQLPLEMEDGTVIIDNASDLTHLRDLNGEMPEHYDLENASSIAPSDIDVVDHYRHFHDGGKHKRKKAQSNHSNPHSHHSQVSSRHYYSDNPAVLSSVQFMNDLPRTTPTPSLSPMNQLSRQSPNFRNSPLTHVNMHGHNMPVTDINTGSRTASERSLASHRSKNSSSKPHKPKRQMLPNRRSPHSNNMDSPHVRKLSNHNYENQQFLTLEEVERLNSRPHESPASMQEAFSTSSDNNTRNQQKPFTQYQHDTNVLLEPPESSSDDSANDSFTCSEFEGENDKQRNDFDPRNRIFPNLAEVANENEDSGHHNKTFKGDGLDSGGNSFSSNGQAGSSDEQQALKAKAMNAAFNWDDLLNWGPKFEKLVGVFTDIALLPDGDEADFGDLDGKVATDGEEYV